MHEILGRPGVGGFDLDLLAGRHLLQQAAGFQDRQRAFHALGVELAHLPHPAASGAAAFPFALLESTLALPQASTRLAERMSAPPMILFRPSSSPASQAAEPTPTRTSSINIMLARAGDMRLAPQRLRPIAGTTQNAAAARIQPMLAARPPAVGTVSAQPSMKTSNPAVSAAKTNCRNVFSIMEALFARLVAT